MEGTWSKRTNGAVWHQGILCCTLGAVFGLMNKPCAAMLTECIRPSATDILALASMKNIEKCDTYCELQNPMSHQVLERKLCPRPLG
jgi:hypothetical protein